VKVGVVLFPKVYNAVTRRDHCGACDRALATGQSRCICGAQFVGKVRS
jgi:hypothetical protein